MEINGDAAAFGKIVQETAQAKWSITSPQQFAAFMANRETITNLYPDPAARKAAIGRYSALYQGHKDPLGPNANIEPDAGVVIHVVGVPSAALEEAIPALRGNLLYTDALRARKKELARSLRGRGIYTMTALESFCPEGLFAPRERAAIVTVLHSEARLQDTNNAWALARVVDALARIPAPPGSPHPAPAKGAPSVA